jgi:hypothetical protein
MSDAAAPIIWAVGFGVHIIAEQGKQTTNALSPAGL